MPLADERGVLPWHRLAGVGELRVVVRELPVVQLRGEGHRPLRVLRDPHAVVRHVSGAWRDEADVEHAARLEGVALVDRVAVRIELIRLVEVRAGFDRTSPLVGHLPAPVDDLALGIAPFKFEPDVEGVHGAARKEVANPACAHHHVDACRRAGHQLRLRPVDWRGHLADVADCHLLLLLRFLADGEAGHCLRRITDAPHHACPLALLVDRRHREDVDADEARLQEFFGLRELLGVVVDERHGGVRRREAVRVDGAVSMAARVGRLHRRHVAVDAGLPLRRVVERARTFTEAAPLPVVVVVEATEPAVVVHRHVEVHLVAGRAVCGLVLAHERLHERAAMRLRVEVSEEPIEPAHHRVLARGQFMQRRIFDREPGIPHRPLDVRDGVARGAGEAGVGLGRVELVLDRLVEAAVEEHRMVVAAGAPLARLGADGVLHVLDRLPVELVVERGEVVHRSLPLLVDVLVALAAQRRVHEEVRGDDAAGVRLRGRGEERRRGAAAFLRHAHRRHKRIDNAVVRVGVRLRPQGGRHRQHHQEHRRRLHRRREAACTRNA